MTRHYFQHISGTLFCLALAVAAAGCSDDKKTMESTAQMPPPVVAVMEIVPENVPLQSTYMGQTMGYLSATVSAQVGGILKQRTYKEGDYVAKGQVLFEIDPASYQAALDQAQGQLTMAQTQYNNAKREYDRILPLYARNAVSQRDRDNAQAAYDSARAQVESAKASVEQAQIQLGYTKVVAPISGYTSSESVTEGNLISPGTPLTTINQTDPMYVNFSIPSAEMRMTKRLEAEKRARTTIRDADAVMQLLEGEQFPHVGRVTFVDTKVDPATSAIHARAQFPNPAGGLLPASTPRFPSAPLRWSTPCWCRRTPCCKPPRDLWSIRSIPRTNTPWPVSRPSSWEKFSATNFCWTAGLNRAPPSWWRASTKYGRTARSRRNFCRAPPAGRRCPRPTR